MAAEDAWTGSGAAMPTSGVSSRLPDSLVPFNARMGSILLARWGRDPAAGAGPPRSAEPSAAAIDGSLPLIPVKLGRHQAPRAMAAGTPTARPDRQQDQHLRIYQPDHRAGPGAERHSQSPAPAYAGLPQKPSRRRGRWWPQRRRRPKPADRSAMSPPGQRAFSSSCAASVFIS